MNLSEYKNQLAANPDAVNDGTWYARSSVQHDGKVFNRGAQLPKDLTNGQVLALLDVNALTSVAPKEDENVVVAPVHNGAPNQQGTVEDGVAHGNAQTSTPTDAEIAAAAASQDGEGQQ